MRRSLLTIFVSLLFFGGSLSAQTDITKVSSAIDQFVTDFTPALPNLAETGLVWSHAYIGEFPKLGAGISINGAFIPKSTFQGVADGLGVQLPAEISKVPDWLGLPIPAYTAEARIGGFILPFDVGVKFGFIPDSVKLTDMTMEYQLIGADVRYRVIEGGSVIIPTISVGAGVSQLHGVVSYTMGDIIVANVPTGPSTSQDIALGKPKATLGWDATVLNAHAQASWDFFFLTPYAGLDLSYSNASSFASFESQLVKSPSGTPLTPTEIQQLNDYDTSGMDFSNLGFKKSGISKGAFAYKVMAGTSLDLVFLVIDINAGYNPVGKSIAAGVNARLRLY